MAHRLIVLLALFCSAKPATLSKSCEGFSLGSYYGSSMVLQRAPARAGIWGYAGNVDDEITIQLDQQVIITNAFIGPEHRIIWRATLEPVEAGGPYTITVTSGECEIQMTDVMFGDVWFCSGQSNMVHRLDRLDEPQPDIDDVVNFPDVRTFRSRLVFSDEPQYDMTNPSQQWSRPDPEITRAFSAVCWLFGRNLNRELGIPIGLVQSAWGGTRIEAWSPPEIFEECFPDGTEDRENQNGKSVLFNTMVHPFLRMPITGAIWYQGEANGYNAPEYGCALGSMVKYWRNKFFESTNGQTDPMFAFGQVQLAPFRDTDRDTPFPVVRWHQTAAFGYTPNPDLERIFTAVAMDLPDFSSPYGSIHPRYKRQIADRLTRGALNLGYGQTDVIFQGPFPTNHLLFRRGLEIIFDNEEAQLDFRSTDGFEICCAQVENTFCGSGTGAQWFAAPIVETSPTSLVLYVTCLPDDKIAGVRYAWKESPCSLEECAVYSAESGLPAPPYVINQYLIEDDA